jgi:hypothetical protein
MRRHSDTLRRARVRTAAGREAQNTSLASCAVCACTQNASVRLLTRILHVRTRTYHTGVILSLLVAALLQICAACVRVRKLHRSRIAYPRARIATAASPPDSHNCAPAAQLCVLQGCDTKERACKAASARPLSWQWLVGASTSRHCSRLRPRYAAPQCLVSRAASTGALTRGPKDTPAVRLHESARKRARGAHASRARAAPAGACGVVSAVACH